MQAGRVITPPLDREFEAETPLHEQCHAGSKDGCLKLGP